MSHDTAAMTRLSSRSGILACALALVIAMAGCVAKRPAPVSDRAPQPKAAKPPAAAAKPAPPRLADARAEFYTVKQGDTLYSIALDHGLDYRELAAWNGIDPSRIRIGQQLRLTPPAGAVVTSPLKAAPGALEARPLDGKPPAAVATDGNTKTQPQGVRLPYTDQTYAQLAKTETPATALKPEARPEPKPEARPAIQGDDDLDWAWPTTGRVIAGFNDSTSKGIVIAGKLGQPIHASAPGRVIFSGTGIRGFGKLIVIKHNNTFLSVYAHNSELLVKEGQTVARGQRIAEMGNSDADQVKLHFEIRRMGRPVDPAKLLPDRAG